MHFNNSRRLESHWNLFRQFWVHFRQIKPPNFLHSLETRNGHKFTKKSQHFQSKTIPQRQFQSILLLPFKFQTFPAQKRQLGGTGRKTKTIVSFLAKLAQTMTRKRGFARKEGETKPFWWFWMCLRGDVVWNWWKTVKIWSILVIFGPNWTKRRGKRREATRSTRNRSVLLVSLD